MTAHSPYPAPSSQGAWRPGLLPSIPAGVLVGILVAGLAREWRWTTNHFPLDPGPATDLLIVAGVAGLAMLIGLGLFVSRNAATGAWLFVLGVALSCGTAIGFFTGPAIP